MSREVRQGSKVRRSIICRSLFTVIRIKRTLLLAVKEGLACLSTAELKKKFDSNEEELGKLVRCS